MSCFISYDKDTDFPVQNLPYGVFERSGQSAHIGVAIGDQVLDLHVLASKGLFDGDVGRALSQVFTACFGVYRSFVLIYLTSLFSD